MATDESGRPTRRAPNHPLRQLHVYFDADEFDREIEQHGDRLLWEQASRCACYGNDDTGSANVACPVCLGDGWEYHTPLEIQGIVDRLEVQKNALLELGDWAMGTMMVTVRPLHRLNFRDRLRVLDNVVSHSEVITRGMTAVDRLAFPVAKTYETHLVDTPSGQVQQQVEIGVIRLRVVAADRKPGSVLRQGLDFDVDANGQIDWSLGEARGTAPNRRGAGAPGGRYAITYCHRPAYVVANWPYGVRTLHTRGTTTAHVRKPGPITAVAQLTNRLHHNVEAANG